MTGSNSRSQIRQPNCGRISRSPGAVISTISIDRSRSGTPSDSPIAPVWSTASGQVKPRPMKDESGWPGSSYLRSVVGHQLIATIAPLTVSGPPASTVAIAAGLERRALAASTRP